MHVFKYLLMFLCVTAHLSHANTDARTWNLKDGKQIFAELIDYTPDTGGVLLNIEEREERILHFDSFSLIDQAWLVQWDEFSDELETKLAQLGGSFQHITSERKYATDLYVYYPANHSLDVRLPALILFNAGGKAARYCLRHMEAAEAVGMIVVACGSFRNTDLDFEKEKAFLEQFRELFPVILDEVELDPTRIFLGGNSGGALRAFHYSAWVNHPWAGIYSNGGWLGGPTYHHLPYPSDMRVVLVNGNNDKGANRVIPVMTRVLEDAGNTVGIISFEGGHQIPPQSSQEKAFEWLLQKEQ